MDDLLTGDSHNQDPDPQAELVDELADLIQYHLRREQLEDAMEIWGRLAAAERDQEERLEIAHYLVKKLPVDVDVDALQVALAADSTSELAWLCVTTVLEQRGDFMQALIWYSRATASLRAEDMDRSHWARLMVGGRRRMKATLGIDLNSLDWLGETGEPERADMYLNWFDLLREPTIIRGEVNVWSRLELACALEEWPRRITPSSVNDYYREVERALRAYGERVTVLHRSSEIILEAVKVGAAGRADPRAVVKLSSDSVRTAWPSGRNQPCWCGSGIKYKRCCGGALLPDGVRLAWGPARLRAGAELAVCRV